MFGKKSQDEKIGVPPVPGRGAGRAPADVPQAGPSPHPPAPIRPSAAPQGAGTRPGEANAKKLIVGRDIVVSGELRRCDTLIIEGEVEAVLKDGRELVIAETGLFRGTITVDQARIEGRLEGTVTVRQRLSLRATGRIDGTVRYGELEIEQGGVLTGTAERISEETAPEKVAPETAAAEPVKSPEPEATPDAPAAGGAEPAAPQGGAAPTLPGLPGS